MANEAMREHWTTGAAGWVEHRDLFDAELEGFADLIMAAAAPGPDDVVLDIGCGTGTLAGRSVEAGARAVGVDISPLMVQAAAALVPGAEFHEADAQTDDLAALGPFTRVVSRFGVMFFDDPVAAFANVRRATAPGATMAFVCWRGLDENPMFTLGTTTLQAQLDPPAAPPAEGVPGPLAFADPERVRTAIGDAGWADVAVEPVDVVCDYSREGSDGVEERLLMVLNTSSGRAAQAALEPRLGPERWSELLDDMRAELRAHLVDGRVAFTGAGWLVTATSPGPA